MATTALARITDEQEDATDITTHGLISVMDASGDTKYTWSRHNPTEVEMARASFVSFREKGFAAFRVQRDGSAGDQIREFDPLAEKILFVPQLKGG